jgi:plasmid stabilization system protein ParE
MNYKINLLPDAYSDIKEIIDWYNRAERGLGKKFYESLKSKFKKISINPLHYQLSFNESRSASLDKFPYQIHFKVDQPVRIVIVFAITHTSRNPRIWREKS